MGWVAEGDVRLKTILVFGSEIGKRCGGGNSRLGLRWCTWIWGPSTPWLLASRSSHFAQDDCLVEKGEIEQPVEQSLRSG